MKTELRIFGHCHIYNNETDGLRNSYTYENYQQIYDIMCDSVWQIIVIELPHRVNILFTPQLLIFHLCWTNCYALQTVLTRFYRATAGNASARYCKGLLSVRLSVCRPMYVCQTRALWQNERHFCLHAYTTWKTIHPSFWREQLVRGELYLKFWRQTGPVGAKTPIFNSTSAVTGVQLILIRRPLRSFQRA